VAQSIVAYFSAASAANNHLATRRLAVVTKEPNDINLRRSEKLKE